MRRLFLLLIAGVLILPAMKTNAQTSNMKLDVSSLTVGELRLNYEYLIDDNKSVVVMAGMMIPHRIPNMLYDPTALENEYGSSIDLKNRFGGYMFGAQFRFYLGDNSFPQGFYFSPYLKYHSYNVTTGVMYEDNITASQYMDLNDDEKTHVTLQTDGTYLYNVQGTIEGHLSRFGGGIALGYQWLIGDSFTLDWTFIGIGVEKWNMGLEVSASSENYDPDYQQWADDIKEGAEDFFFIGDKIDVQVEKERVKVELPVVVPFPYTSISIGYCF